MLNTDAMLPEPSPVTATDRMAMTLFFAIALHAIIILGITFGQFDDPLPENILPTLDITVSSRSTAPPEEADYLAQTSQDGGGNTSEKVKPTQAIPEQAPAVMPQQPVQAPTQVVSASVAKEKVHQQETETPDTEKPDVSATELIERSMEMVNLNEQLNESMQAYAHRPRHIYVSARTQEYKYANYMSEWVKKVERVGNLNYPDEARRSGLAGKLIMDVTMNADGTVRNISIMRASGHKVIDEAAKRIVNLAAPFPPFPADILKDADIMHITRTWEFSTSNTLKSR
ncbi:MAG: energy transducer TonB [Gammaproteobacteria bacterium]|nr:MAG: energy transducer TonB [Gammaproteobacteria bacterium]